MLEQTTVETVVYEYNLQNKLSKVTTTTPDATPQTHITSYQYDPDGNRISKIEDSIKQTVYLIDPANHTGYAQVLQETEYNISNPANPVPLNRTDYVLGDDVISQTKSTWSGSAWSTGQTQYLLYDGHGSTRQLVNTNLSVQDAYSYDGYGVMLGSSAEPANDAQTSMLYCGEQYDKSLSQYYLRARYYNPLNGLFNQMDPYTGNTSDPQSLHKYLYVHNNPVNMVDPSGLFTCGEVITMAAIYGLLLSISTAAYGYAKGWSAIRIASTAAISFLMGFGVGLIGGGIAAGIAAAGVGAGLTVGAANAVGLAATALIFGPTSVGLALDNYIYAKEHGDKVDQAFAMIDLGVASAGLVTAHFATFSLMNRTALISRQAKAAQLSGGFKTDDFSDGMTLRGSILYQQSDVENPARVGRWFTTADTLIGTDLDSTVVGGRSQIRNPELRKYVNLYQVVEESESAVGICEANTHLGPGKGPQIFLPKPERSVRYVGTIKLK